MKWILAIGIVLAGAGYMLTLGLGKQEMIPLPSPTGQASTSGQRLVENESLLKNLKTDFGSFRVVWEVVEPSEVVVGMNSDLEFSSAQLMEKNGCRVLTSAAFYDTNNQPLGLLVENGATLSAYRKNVLLNGVMGFSQDKGLVVLTDEVNEGWKWAVQAGPVLWREGEAVELSLTADQDARRVVAGKTTEGKLVLIGVMAADSLYLGPKLGDMPKILESWQQAAGIELEDAINLDGGTASAFLSSTLKLRELKPIGSYICGG